MGLLGPHSPTCGVCPTQDLYCCPPAPSSQRCTVVARRTRGTPPCSLTSTCTPSSALPRRPRLVESSGGACFPGSFPTSSASQHLSASPAAVTTQPSGQKLLPTPRSPIHTKGSGFLGSQSPNKGCGGSRTLPSNLWPFKQRCPPHAPPHTTGWADWKRGTRQRSPSWPRPRTHLHVGPLLRTREPLRGLGTASLHTRTFLPPSPCLSVAQPAAGCRAVGGRLGGLLDPLRSGGPLGLSSPPVTSWPTGRLERHPRVPPHRP